MAGDRYHSYAELSLQEALNEDYRIVVQDVGSPVTVIAPHGGNIEPNTAEIAKLIAGDHYNCYCFEGICKGNNRRLHLTSHQFDEPQALRIISRSIAVVAIHACTGNHARIYLGGLDTALRELIGRRLNIRKIQTVTARTGYKGCNPLNICNRGLTRKGVQLEISRDLRDNHKKRELIAKAVKAALAQAVV